MFIGESPGFPGRVFNGKIDEVRIWNIARSQSQIQNTMNTILTSEYYSSPDSGLAGYWRLDEGTGRQQQIYLFTQTMQHLAHQSILMQAILQWVEANILIVNVEDESKNKPLPISFSLSQNYPNPFNPVTSIEYVVAGSEFVNLKVYDFLGREVTQR